MGRTASLTPVLATPPLLAAGAANEMVHFRLRRAGTGAAQVRAGPDDGNVTYTDLDDSALPFFGWFVRHCDAPGTFQVEAQGWLDIGPAPEMKLAEVVVE
jgi:hypothetical protein